MLPIGVSEMEKERTMITVQISRHLNQKSYIVQVFERIWKQPWKVSQPEKNTHF